MSAEQFALILAGFVTTLLTLFGVIMRWMIKRMDRKDERFAEQSESRAKENRDERDAFLQLSQAFVAQTADRADKFYATAQKFGEAAIAFDATVNRLCDESCVRIEGIESGMQTWKGQWDEIVKKEQESALKRKNFEQGAAIIFDRFADFAAHMEREQQYERDYMEASLEERKLMREQNMLITKALKSICEALDIKINGNGEWNGIERRQ